jgi:hypothetical protein
MEPLEQQLWHPRFVLQNSPLIGGVIEAGGGVRVLIAVQAAGEVGLEEAACLRIGGI